MKKSLYIGAWAICCNDMATAIIDDRIQASLPEVEDSEEEIPNLFIDVGANLAYCPWCGKGIKDEDTP